MTMREQHLGASRIARDHVAPNASRLLLLGEDNPQSIRPEFALWNDPPNCAGERLQRLILALEPRTYLACWRTNLCSPRWSAPRARERAAELLVGDHPWTTIVLLGRNVASATATGLALEPFTSVALPDGRFVISIPHPSGRNLVWNDPDARARARAMVRQRVPGLWL